MLITDRNAFPLCIRHFQEVKGLAIKECYIDGEFSLNKNARGAGDIAHAHCGYGDRCLPGYGSGWICFRDEEIARDKYVLLHEVAHLRAPPYGSGDGHHDAWRAEVLRLGGTLKAHGRGRSYHKSAFKQALSELFSPLI
jgi:hypothetical protein